MIWGEIMASFMDLVGCFMGRSDIAVGESNGYDFLKNVISVQARISVAE